LPHAVAAVAHDSRQQLRDDKRLSVFLLSAHGTQTANLRERNALVLQ
jgi:hypothetical protein